MIEPLKLGLPLALLYAALMYAQLYLRLVDLTVFRWLAAGVSLGFLSNIYYSGRSLGVVVLRDLWFTGFTMGVASNLVFVLLLFLFQSTFIEHINMSDSSNYNQLVVIEFISQLTFGIVAHSIFTISYFILKRQKHE